MPGADVPGADVPGADVPGGPDTGVGGTLIVASAGGRVASADGIFWLQIPPGALSADTVFSARALETSEWPSDLAPADVVGEIYRVEPSGTTFSIPARAHWRFPTIPAAMASGTSAYAIEVVLDTGASRETAPLTEASIDGTAAALDADIPHLTDLGARCSCTWSTASPVDGYPDPCVFAGVGRRMDPPGRPRTQKPASVGGQRRLSRVRRDAHEEESVK